MIHGEEGDEPPKNNTPNNDQSIDLQQAVELIKIHISNATKQLVERSKNLAAPNFVGDQTETSRCDRNLRQSLNNVRHARPHGSIEFESLKGI
jgi:hypothetical protein